MQKLIALKLEIHIHSAFVCLFTFDHYAHQFELKNI